MSSSRETSWTLPLSICLELDAEQQDFIRDRIYEFEQRTKRTARAKMPPTAAGGHQQTAAAAAGLDVAAPTGHQPLQTDIHGYIKPSPSPSSASRHLSPSRPVSVFPPINSDDKQNAAARRGSDDVVYMPMNGPAGKQ